MKTTENLKTSSFLSFNLKEEVFATDVKSVLSILELPRITRIPKAPNFLKGIINLRGEVLPIIDIHYKFGMPEAKITSNTCILVMESSIDNQYIKFGILVDRVNEVYEISLQDILPAPTIGSKFKSDFIEGIYKTDETFIMIIDIAKVLIADDFAILQKTVSEKTSVEETQLINL